MSNAMRNRMTAAKSGAGESVKAKTHKAPLVESTVDLHVVPEATVTQVTFGTAEDTSTAVAAAVDVLTSAAPISDEVDKGDDDAPIVLPKITRTDNAPDPTPDVAAAPPSTSAPASTVTAPATRRKALKGEALLAQITAPPAAMGTAGESRILSVPMSEDTYRLLQQLDRDLALSRKRPVNRVRLVTTALEQVLANPGNYADRYLEQHNAGVTWKRRVQARVPVELADQLPLLRYTGEHRQSAGMLVSIAVGEMLEAARADVPRV